ncbi:MAG: hypothetical protein NC293_13235 [Roseburia sp.]|nr:hypothetical protein [Roseburia sp.]
MKGKLTLTQIRVILILVAILLIVLTYFFIYQTNMDKVSDFEKKTAEANERITYLESLQPQVTDLEIFTSLYVDDIDDFIQSFPVKITQQKSIYLIYRLMINTGIDIESISEGTPAPFYYKGQVLGQGISAPEGEEETEAISEIAVVDMDQMIGSSATYTINFSGSIKQVFKALDWITENKEKLSVGDVSVQFDSSTGKLTGSMGINFYCMLGNGVPYKDPDISEFNYGKDNIFGEFSKD